MFVLEDGPIHGILQAEHFQRSDLKRTLIHGADRIYACASGSTSLQIYEDSPNTSDCDGVIHVDRAGDVE